jgi:hypothetical protein
MWWRCAAAGACVGAAAGTPAVLAATARQHTSTCSRPAPISVPPCSPPLCAPLQAIVDTQLERLFLRNTGISGELACDLMLPTMTHLSLATNNLDGTLPDCIVQGPELKELFLSR